ncbi:MAG: AAA family ATPase [Rhizobiaceae bacterium]|nr:AAA family ATPase [Rhizobiaceae bacterium]
MLVILSGLPGAGKTTIARLVCQRLGAVHVRIDTIEQALLAADDSVRMVGTAGYMIAYGVALDNLRIGATVVADSVNPLDVTRRAWRDVGSAAEVDTLDVEIICSNPADHRRRVEARATDVDEVKPSQWSDVVGREYDPWGDDAVTVDTAGRTPDECAAEIVAAVSRQLKKYS